MQSIVLGTAQWGLDYGVTNGAGRLSDASVAEIAALSLASGVTRVDTAPGYGDAELRLRPWARQFGVGTKVRGADPETLGRQLEVSLERLGLQRIESCLVHDWPTLTDEQSLEVATRMRRLSDSGSVSLIGVSAYDEEDLARARSAFDRVDIVQVPINALDERLVTSPSLRSMLGRGTRVQARSVLLQGLLAARSATTLGGHPDIRRFHDRCDETERDPVEVALAHVRSLSWVSEVVLGVTSARELQAILDVWSAEALPPLDGVASSDEGLIDPRLWRDPRVL